ncbi:MAG: DUF2953 domain-containing protein [Clostridiales bacterium]|nr:DUF2953 domain-containing protein [Clostridiales bacterium]
MKAIYILAIIIFIIFVLLVCPIVLSVKQKDDLAVYVRYIFVRIRLYPQKEKPEKQEKETKETKKKKEKEKPEEKKKPNVFKEKLDKDGLSEFLDNVKYAVNRVKKIPVFIKRHLIFSKLFINISVSDEDAATAAVNYGRACSVIYPAYSFFLSNFRCRKTSVNVIADFDKKESSAEADIKIKIKLIFIIIAAFKALFAGIDILKAFSKIKNLKNKEKQKEGVKQ